jgi:hypothetical protein
MIFLLEKVHNLDIQRHAIIQASLLMHNLTARVSEKMKGVKNKDLVKEFDISSFFDVLFLKGLRIYL